jgi:hypothetical protein
MTATAPRPDPPAGHHHHPPAPEAKLPPSRDGSVVMDIGGDIGALVLYTDPELDGAEIDLFEPGSPQPFVHSAVRPRLLTGGTTHAAVYPGLRAGSYVVAAHGAVPATPVVIEGGRITEVPR